MLKKQEKQGRPSGGGATSRPAAWDLLDDHLVARVLDALPVTRIFAAFADEAHGAVPALFCLCLRAAVPFAVVDALLQDRYRVRPRGDADAQHDSDGAGDGAGARKPLPWPSPWASCCACLPCCYPYGPASESGPMRCPRGRLVRVPARTALRIAAWQWASVVTGCVGAALRWPSAEDVGPSPALYPQKAAKEDSGHAHDWGAVVRIRSGGCSLIGGWPRDAGTGNYVARPFEHYGAPVRRLTHPWDARIHVDLYDRTRPSATVDADRGGEEEDVQRYLPLAVARVDDDPVFLVAVYRTAIMAT
ncbi:hypothetical protein [Pandoravirus japonicus]|uniref:Uncharacterized protein n=1 Tax=Pandoravirus japonicus TaxID=2823154 RepID=A0A811BPN5_9VIRU|nr:hypothetical protein [Pandoravirus japonicus]